MLNFDTSSFKESKTIKISFPLTEVEEHIALVIYSIDQICTEMENILESSESKKSAQKKLEGLHSRFLTTRRKLTHRIPPEVLHYVEKINLLLTGNTPEDHYIKKLGNIPYSFNRLGDKKRRFLEKYNVVLTTLKREDENIGLLIVFHFNEIIKKMINLSLVNIPHGTAIEKTDIYNTELKNLQFRLKTTNTLMTISKFLLTCYRYHYNKKIRNMTNEATEDNETLTFNIEEEVMLAEQIAFYLETANIVQYSNLEKDSTNYYTITPDFIKAFNRMYYYSNSIPFVYKPANWKLDNNDFPNFGGLYMNTGGIYPGVHLKGQHSQIKVRQTHIDAINYLQTIEFKINRNALEYILQDPSLALIKYIEKSFGDDNTWKDVFQIRNTSEWHLKTERSYIKGLVSAKTSITVLRASQAKYKALISSITQFYYIIKIATTFKKESLYFQCFLDSRGRIYYNSFGISPQGDTLSKVLLDVKEKKETYGGIIQTISKPIEYVWEGLFGAEFWKFLGQRCESNIKKLDVTCSGLQIIAGLCGDTKGLIDTNLIKTNESKQAKQDLYEIVRSSMMKKYEILFDEFNNPELRTLLKQFRDEDFDRTFVKGWVMRYVYSEGNYARTLFLLDECNSFKAHMSISRKILYKVAQAISIIFVKSMDENYPQICKFSAQLQDLFGKYIDNKQNGPVMIILSSKNSLVSEIDTCKQEIKKFSYFNQKLKRRVKMSLKVNTNTLNRRKLKNAIVPNFIHHLDAEILTDVILKCKRKNIPLATVHDCFCVFEKDMELIKRFYYDSFIKIVLNKGLYLEETNYFRLMDANLSFKESQLYEEKSKQLKSICSPLLTRQTSLLDNIDLGMFKMSPFILSE